PLASPPVWVFRNPELDKHDQLFCERLELQFHHKAKDAAGVKGGTPGNEARAGEEDRMMDLEIETAHATGQNVLLTSDDTESLQAHGDDFFYNAQTGLTILKGKPDPDDREHRERYLGIWAEKGVNKIYARELHIVSQKGA